MVQKYVEGQFKRMRSIVISVVVGIVCLTVGLFVGAWQSEQVKSTKVGQAITTATEKVPWTKTGTDDAESQFESYEYPTIKWKPKALPDNDGAIVRLWTTFEGGTKDVPQGTMKYKLTLFKAANKDNREVQLLDATGFKILQFNANDFHRIPGAPDIVEARDGVQCSEDQYKKTKDYSVK